MYLTVVRRKMLRLSALISITRSYTKLQLVMQVPAALNRNQQQQQQQRQ